MLPPDLEIHPAYLRTLRRTINDVLFSEVESASGRNAVSLCDAVFVRLIAVLEEHPACDATSPVQIRALFGGEIGEVDAKSLARISETNALSCENYEAAVARIRERHEPPLRSLLVTPAAVQAYLASRFPGVRLRKSDQLPGGRSKLTLLLSIEENRPLPSEIVLRIDNPGTAQNTTVAAEFPVLDALYRAGVSTPEPLWLETDSAHLGAPFLAMRRMKGAEPGASVWSAEGVSPRIAIALAEALARLHNQRASSAWPDAPDAAQDAVAQMIAELESAWRAGRNIPSLTIECAFSWLARHLAWVTGPSVAVHGDVHFGNVLADGDMLTCLTDWEFAHPGHAAEDLAFCRGYIEQIMPWEEFMARYRERGGVAVDDEQLRFFAVWRYLRNVTLATNMLKRFIDGAAYDVDSLSIALHSRARIEAMLAQTLATELKRDAAL